MLALIRTHFSLSLLKGPWHAHGWTEILPLDNVEICHYAEMLENTLMWSSTQILLMTTRHLTHDQSDMILRISDIY